MSQKSYCIILIAIFIASFVVVSAASNNTSTNIGFVKDNIWYSKEPLFDGDTARVYSVVFNSGNDDFFGTVEFYANDVLIGRSPFSLTSGESQVVFVDWKALKGEYKITARIIDAKINNAGQEPTTATFTNNKTGSISAFVDGDADRDGVGDKIDTDDDNDGLRDDIEIARKTDPLKADTDSDGESDRTDPYPNNVLLTSKGTTTAYLKNNTSTGGSTIAIAEKAMSALNNALDSGREVVDEKRNDLRAQLAFQKSKQSAGSTVVGSKKSAQIPTKPLTIFQYIYLWLLDAASFVLKYKILFYFLAGYVLYRIIRRMLRRKLRRRRR